MAKYEVLVGNIGTVISTDDLKEAQAKFDAYVEQSKQERGRACGEDVALLEDGEPIKEHSGSLHDGEEMGKGGAIEKTNDGVIRAFLEDSFPKDKMPEWGTPNLKIKRFSDYWALVNYSTELLSRKNGELQFNEKKYSPTTSTIQNKIKSIASELNLKLTTMKEKGGAAGDMDYEKDILPVLKSATEDAWESVAKKYHLYDEKAHEIENKSRPGFIPFTDGGYYISSFAPLYEFNDTGLRMPTEKGQKTVDDWIEECESETKGKTDEGGDDYYEKLQNCMDNYYVDFAVKTIYFNPENNRNEFKPHHAISVFGIVNDDSIHEDNHEEMFSFDSVEELEEKLSDAMKKVLDWFKVGEKKAKGGKAGGKSGIKPKGKVKTKSITVFQFEDLSKAAKEKALEWARYIAVDDQWWDSTYEDAANIGLKITGFDIDRGRYADGKFISGAEETANKIIEEHGDMTDTYKTAKEYLKDYDALVEKFSDGVKKNIVAEDKIYDFDGEADDLQAEFLKSLLEDYVKMLRDEYEYLQSDKAVQEFIEGNEYEFMEDGSRAQFGKGGSIGSAWNSFWSSYCNDGALITGGCYLDGSPVLAKGGFASSAGRLFGKAKQHAKTAYKKSEDFTKKKIHDHKKDVALEVLGATAGKVDDFKGKIDLKEAENLVKDEYGKGGKAYPQKREPMSKRGRQIDGKVRAKKAGWRVSEETGNKYFERRENRCDRSPKSKR